MKRLDFGAVRAADIDMTDSRDSQTAAGTLLESVRRTARRFFDQARGSHDWEHTLRVFRLCERIGPKEDADMEVLLVAAYLHDIGRSFQDSSEGAICHAEKGAEMAMDVVAGLKLSEKQKENVIHCVRSHRFRGNHVPETKEAKALFDADKLDAIGAVGVARAFLFAGEVGARLHSPGINIEETQPYSEHDTGYREYKMKLAKIRDRILTPTGRKLAKERHEFMAHFFKRFIQEYEGER